MGDEARRRAKAQVVEQIEAASADLWFAKRLSNLMLLVGIAALADAVLQTGLALALSTGAFLIATKVSHIAAAVGIVLGLLLPFWI